MVGVILLYVGAVLLVNGMGGLGHADNRSMAVMNFMVGALALVASLLQFIRADSMADYYGVATFFLFTFTYIYVAISMWFDLDMRGFGWFCLFVALTTVPCSIVAFQGGDRMFGSFWLIWGTLWYMFYLANVPGKDFGKLLPYATIGVGVATCWIPGLLILTEQITL
ncbi:MAG: AmiS/UreI family transporter [Gammaproteobacteria bacterium]